MNFHRKHLTIVDIISYNVHVKILNLNFEGKKTFIPNNFHSLKEMVGLYFIFSSNRLINYPFKESRLLYIGMSEKRTNSIGKRLKDHYEGISRNDCILNYKDVDNVLFTYINFKMLKKFWNYRIEDLESYFLLDFQERYGSYPICNNKSGYNIINFQFKYEFNINWSFFEE